MPTTRSGKVSSPVSKKRAVNRKPSVESSGANHSVSLAKSSVVEESEGEEEEEEADVDMVSNIAFSTHVYDEDYEMS